MEHGVALQGTAQAAVITGGTTDMTTAATNLQTSNNAAFGVCASTVAGAQTAITSVDIAIKDVSSERSKLGAY